MHSQALPTQQQELAPLWQLVQSEGLPQGKHVRLRPWQPRVGDHAGGDDVARLHHPPPPTAGRSGLGPAAEALVGLLEDAHGAEPDLVGHE
jgi:hypothetical protein